MPMRILGEGAFGKVLLAHKGTDTQDQVAIKFLLKEQILSSSVSLTQLRSEVSVHWVL
jgi:serine/threonine protein kinase